MQHVGVDIVEINRIENVIAHWGDKFLKRVFTPTELTNYGNRNSSLAARFAAKEAVLKALGLGIGAGVPFREIEITRGARGNPVLVLLGNAREAAANQGITCVHLSISHTRDNAVAFVVAETAEKPEP